MKFIFPLIAVLVVSSFMLGGSLFSKTVYIDTSTQLKLLPQELMSSSIGVPAIDESGNGVVTEIEVTIEPGQGRILLDLDKQGPLSYFDTQNSILTARDVAQEITGFDLSTHDIVYTIKADASIIEGPSAGAAFTIATIAALEGYELNPAVRITGTINPDGTIGRVGGVEQKAFAAKQDGATLFLVPERGGLPLQSYETEMVRHCTEINGFHVCEIEYQKTKDPSDIYGIQVIEVGSVEEALKYFIMDDEQ